MACLLFLLVLCRLKDPKPSSQPTASPLLKRTANLVPPPPSEDPGTSSPSPSTATQVPPPQPALSAEVKEYNYWSGAAKTSSDALFEGGPQPVFNGAGVKTDLVTSTEMADLLVPQYSMVYNLSVAGEWAQVGVANQLGAGVVGEAEVGVVYQQ